MEAHRRSIVTIGSILASVQKVWSEDPEKAPLLQKILEKTDERLKKEAAGRGKKGQKGKKKEKNRKSDRKEKSRKGKSDKR